MIDWLTLRVVSAYTPEAGTVTSLTADGEVEWRIAKRVQVEGSHSATVTLRTVPWDKTACGSLEISGNPVKFMQGHNLFGTDDLANLVPAFVRAVYARIGYQASDAELAAIDQGKCWLTRIDVNRNADFGNLPRSLSAIRALSECSHLSHRGRGSLTHEGTCYWGQKSRYFSLKAYAKGLEIQKHKLAESLPNRNQLIGYAEGIVRREATIWKRELCRRGLQCVGNWATLKVTPDSLFDELFGRVNIAEATMRLHDNSEAIPPRLRSVYQLWRDGHDLRTLVSRPTFYRHRKALLAHGVDIALKQPRDVSNVVPLVVTLVGREVGVPTWARGTPLYFDPAAAAA